MVDFNKHLKPKPKPKPAQIKTAAMLAKAMLEPSFQFSITAMDELANQVLIEARAGELQREAIANTARTETMIEMGHKVSVLFRRAKRNEASTAIKYLNLLHRWLGGDWEPCPHCQADPFKGKCKCPK